MKIKRYKVGKMKKDRKRKQRGGGGGRETTITKKTDIPTDRQAARERTTGRCEIGG